MQEGVRLRTVDREEREERWSGLRERREATANAVHHATANNDNAKKDNANNYKFNNDINDNDKSNNGNGNNESNDSNNSRDNIDDKNSNDDTTSNNDNNTDHQLSPVHRVGSPGGGGSRSNLGGVDGRSPGNGSPGSFRGRNFGGRSFGGVGSGGSSGSGGNYNDAGSRSSPGSPGINGGDGGNHNSFGSYGSYGSSSGRRSGGKGTLYGDELEQDIVDAEALAQRAKRRIELIQNGIKQVRKQQEKGLGRLKRLTPKKSRSKRKRGAQKTPWYPVDF